MEHTASFDRKHNDPYKKEDLRRRLTMMYFSPEELKLDEDKWKTILSDVDITHDGYIYFNEFESAINKFVTPPTVEEEFFKDDQEDDPSPLPVFKIKSYLTIKIGEEISGN